MDVFVTVIQDIGGKTMKVEIIQSESVSDIDKLTNACIQNRLVHDIKFSSTTQNNGKILFTALIMLDS